jgi:hypothetical protein
MSPIPYEKCDCKLGAPGHKVASGSSFIVCAREVQMYATSIPAGRLTIRAGTDDTMSCELWLDDHFVGYYPSADAAARSVSQHSSGCDLIDDVQTPLPNSIDAWQWISVRSTVAADHPMFRAPAATPPASRL